jgi:hypothetical protein
MDPGANLTGTINQPGTIDWGNSILALMLTVIPSSFPDTLYESLRTPALLRTDC